jgi:hypothetical protein
MVKESVWRGMSDMGHRGGRARQDHVIAEHNNRPKSEPAGEHRDVVNRAYLLHSLDCPLDNA